MIIKGSDELLVLLEIFITTYLETDLLNIGQLPLAVPHSYQRPVEADRHLVLIDVEIELLLRRFRHAKPADDGIVAYQHQVLHDVVLGEVPRDVLHEVPVCQLHHILGAAFLCLSAYVLSACLYLLAHLVETLDSAYGKSGFLRPNFDNSDARVRNLSDDSTVGKPNSFLSRKPLFIIFQVRLI